MTSHFTRLSQHWRSLQWWHVLRKMVVFFVSYVPILVSYLDLDPSAGSAGVFQEVSLEIQHKGRGCVAGGVCYVTSHLMDQERSTLMSKCDFPCLRTVVWVPFSAVDTQLGNTKGIWPVKSCSSCLQMLSFGDPAQLAVNKGHVYVCVCAREKCRWM